MQLKIKVKTLQGGDHEIEIDSEATLNDLRNIIAERANVPPDRQRIIFQGKPMLDRIKTIASYGIQDGFSLHMVEKMPIVPSTAGSSSQTSSGSGRTMDTQGEVQTRGRNMVVGNIPVERTNLFQNPQETLRVIDEIIAQIRTDWNIETTANLIENRPNQEDFSINVLLRGIRERHADSPARHRVDTCYFFLRRQRYILFFIETIFHARVDGVLSNRSNTGLKAEENGEEVFQEIVRTIREVDETDLMDITEIRNNHPAIFEAIESIRSVSATFPADDAHHEPMGEDFIMRHVTGEDLDELLIHVQRVQEILNREIVRYGAVLRLNRTFELDSFASDLLNAYTTTITRLLHRQSHIHHIISDLNVHMENPAPRRLYPQYTNYVRDEPPFADLSILFYHPRNSSPSHSPMRPRQTAIRGNASQLNGMFFPVSPPGMATPTAMRMPVRLDMINHMFGQAAMAAAAQAGPQQGNIVRLPGGGSIQNSNMHFNIAPNIGVRVNVQRAQIPVGMQVHPMRPGGGGPGLPPGIRQATMTIRIPRGVNLPQGMQLNQMPTAHVVGGRLPNPSFMGSINGPRVQGQQQQPPQQNLSTGQNSQNQQARPNNPVNLIGNLISSIFGGGAGGSRTSNVQTSHSTQNLSMAGSNISATNEGRLGSGGLPRVPSAPVISDTQRDRDDSESLPERPQRLPTPEFMQRLAEVERLDNRVAAIGWQQQPVHTNALFLGPRPPSTVPIYTFDQYLCCYSRHYRAFTPQLIRRHDVSLIEPATSSASTDQTQNSNSQSSSTAGSIPQFMGQSSSTSRPEDQSAANQVAVNNNGELVFTENEMFANFVRSALRSVLTNMADVNPAIGHGNPFVGGRVTAFSPIFNGGYVGPVHHHHHHHHVGDGFGQQIPFQRVMSMGMEEQSPPHEGDDHEHDGEMIEGTIEIEGLFGDQNRNELDAAQEDNVLNANASDADSFDSMSSFDNESSVSESENEGEVQQAVPSLSSTQQALSSSEGDCDWEGESSSSDEHFSEYET